MIYELNSAQADLQSCIDRNDVSFNNNHTELKFQWISKYWNKWLQTRSPKHHWCKNWLWRKRSVTIRVVDMKECVIGIDFRIFGATHVHFRTEKKTETLVRVLATAQSQRGNSKKHVSTHFPLICSFNRSLFLFQTIDQKSDTWQHEIHNVQRA